MVELLKTIGAVVLGEGPRLTPARRPLTLWSA